VFTAPGGTGSRTEPVAVGGVGVIVTVLPCVESQSGVIFQVIWVISSRTVSKNTGTGPAFNVSVQEGPVGGASGRGGASAGGASAGGAASAGGGSPAGGGSSARGSASARAASCAGR